MLAFATLGGYFITYYADEEVTIGNAPTPGSPDDPSEIEEPNSISALSWAFNSLAFVSGLSAFAIAGVPLIFSLIAWVVDAVAIFLLIIVIRGN
jgi:hypothetical protein